MILLYGSSFGGFVVIPVGQRPDRILAEVRSGIGGGWRSAPVEETSITTEGLAVGACWGCLRVTEEMVAKTIRDKLVQLL